MPAKNLYHDAVREALVADGWTITHDPLSISVGTRRIHVDLAADRDALGAEKDGVRIAIEVQSFLSKSPVEDLHHAVGQYVVYRAVLRHEQPGRELFLAVPAGVVRAGILGELLGRLVTADCGIKLLLFHPITRRIVEWRS